MNETRKDQPDFIDWEKFRGTAEYAEELVLQVLAIYAEVSHLNENDLDGIQKRVTEAATKKTPITDDRIKEIFSHENINDIDVAAIRKDFEQYYADDKKVEHILEGGIRKNSKSKVN